MVKPMLILLTVTGSVFLGHQSQEARRSGLDLVAVAGGTYQMGGADLVDDGGPPGMRLADECRHPVAVASFSIGRYEVTREDWIEVMGALPTNQEGCPECPVSQVSWNDAQAFITELNARTGLGYRLPTEEEWEFAARGGLESQGYMYAGSNIAEDVAWFDANSEGRPHRVGELAPNELGLHDMSGNIREWTASTKRSYPCDFAGVDLDVAVLRGGAYAHRVSNMRVRDRNGREQDTRLPTLGFRLAR